MSDDYGQAYHDGYTAGLHDGRADVARLTRELEEARHILRSFDGRPCIWCTGGFGDHAPDCAYGKVLGLPIPR